MNTLLLYIALLAIWYYLFTCARSLYDIMDTFFIGVMFHAYGFQKYPIALVVLHCLMLLFGFIYVCVALWDSASNRTRISYLYRRRLSFLIGSTLLSEHQKIVRANCYVIFQGLILFVFGILGLLVPDTFFGFIGIEKQ